MSRLTIGRVRHDTPTPRCQPLNPLHLRQRCFTAFLENAVQLRDGGISNRLPLLGDGKTILRAIDRMFIAFYMGYHTLHGERGLFALMRDRHEVTQLTTELERTKSEREMMERRVSHLRDNSLDRDLLDEQMRRMLGVMKKGEIVVLTGQQG